MAKSKTQFICSECGYASGKWSGQCRPAGAGIPWRKSLWPPHPWGWGKSASAPGRIVTFDKIPLELGKRFRTEIEEFDRVLGGGVVPGGVTPGGRRTGDRKIHPVPAGGKKLTAYGNVLYVSGEESPSQIKMRAKRLGVEENIYLMAETEVGSILAGVEQLSPKFLIVDSIQTLYDADLSSAPGSVGQVRGCASRITQAAKHMGMAAFIVGHVTKEGAIAGPRV